LFFLFFLLAKGARSGEGGLRGVKAVVIGSFDVPTEKNDVKQAKLDWKGAA
jgi:hypothetical protein